MSTEAHSKRIVELLNSFDLNSLDDYRKLPPEQKTLFMGRLYRDLKKSSKDYREHLKNSDGLNLHFDAKRKSQLNGDLPSSTFIKKSCFFAESTFITFPFKEVKGRRSLKSAKPPDKGWPESRGGGKRSLYWGDIRPGSRSPSGGTVRQEGKIYRIDSVSFERLLGAAISMKTAMDNGVVNIQPVFLNDKKRKKIQRKLTSASFKSAELERQFSEVDFDSGRENIGTCRLLLPHFTNVPFDRVLEIRANESVLFTEFQARLSRLILNAADTDSEKVILDFMREVDEGIRDLHEQLKLEKQKLYRKTSIVTISFTSAALLAYFPIALSVGSEAVTLPQLLGGAGACEFVHLVDDALVTRKSFETSKFFVPWEVFRST